MYRFWYLRGVLEPNPVGTEGWVYSVFQMGKISLLVSLSFVFTFLFFLNSDSHSNISHCCKCGQKTRGFTHLVNSYVVISGERMSIILHLAALSIRDAWLVTTVYVWKTHLFFLKRLLPAHEAFWTYKHLLVIVPHSSSSLFSMS